MKNQTFIKIFAGVLVVTAALTFVSYKTAASLTSTQDFPLNALERLPNVKMSPQKTNFYSRLVSGVSANTAQNIAIKTKDGDVAIRQGSESDQVKIGVVIYHSSTEAIQKFKSPPTDKTLVTFSNSKSATLDLTTESLIELLDLKNHAYEVFVEVPPNYSGNLTIESISGDISIEGEGSTQLKAASVSGDVKIHRHKNTQSLVVETISGDIELKGSFANVKLSSISGDVELSSEVALNNLEVSTTSGDVELELSQHQTAKVKFVTTSGCVEASFNDKDVNTTCPRRLETTVGQGKAPAAITVESVSGDIHSST